MQHPRTSTRARARHTSTAMYRRLQCASRAPFLGRSDVSDRYTPAPAPCRRCGPPPPPRCSGRQQGQTHSPNTYTHTPAPAPWRNARAAAAGGAMQHDDDSCGNRRGATIAGPAGLPPRGPAAPFAWLAGATAPAQAAAAVAAVAAMPSLYNAGLHRAGVSGQATGMARDDKQGLWRGGVRRLSTKQHETQRRALGRHAARVPARMKMCDHHAWGGFCAGSVELTSSGFRVESQAAWLHGEQYAKCPKQLHRCAVRALQCWLPLFQQFQLASPRR